jgi:hypothetical protein
MGLNFRIIKLSQEFIDRVFCGDNRYRKSYGFSSLELPLFNASMLPPPKAAVVRDAYFENGGTFKLHYD